MLTRRLLVVETARAFTIPSRWNLYTSYGWGWVVSQCQSTSICILGSLLYGLSSFLFKHPFP